MIRPQPDCWLLVSASTLPSPEPAENLLAFLMKRRNTVSVTPAMGASTVAGAICTLPMVNVAGTRASAGMVLRTGLSKCFCMPPLRPDLPIRGMVFDVFICQLGDSGSESFRFENESRLWVFGTGDIDR